MSQTLAKYGFGQTENKESETPAPAPTADETPSKLEPRAVFPEQFREAEVYRLKCGESWLATRLVRTYKSVEAFDHTKRIARQEFTDAKRAFYDVKPAAGSLPMYKEAYPEPSVDALLITPEEIEKLQLDFKENEKPWDGDLWVSEEFMARLSPGFEQMGKVQTYRETAHDGDEIPTPAPEPEPEAEKCQGHYLSGQKEGEACTADAKENGFCGRHQAQADAEAETDETMFDSEPESDADHSPGIGAKETPEAAVDETAELKAQVADLAKSLSEIAAQLE
jgi:hypothetical protein